MSGERTIRDAIARYASGRIDPRFQPLPGDYQDADAVLAHLGLDPDTVLDRACPTCEGETVDLDFCQECGDEYEEPCDRHAADPASPCPTCHGTGREVVHRIIAVTPDDLTAMRIGRRVALLAQGGATT